MQKLKVDLGADSYEIRAGSGILPRLGRWLGELGYSGRAVVIADAVVKGLYASVVTGSLAESGFQAALLEFPPGEENKTLDNAALLYDELNEALAERGTPVLALGGGVTGDLAGFVAATYMRGVPYIQVPTTLLAMADSSIGGKTAVDRGSLKNVIGVFYQPKLVVADIDTLKTLPAVELSSGMAEVVKHAAIRDAEFFHYLEKNMVKALAFDAGIMEYLVMKNVQIKASVVAVDERETGLRAILNCGHTVGHAVEVVSGFSLKHGQAVAVGIMAEARISQRLGVLAPADVARLEKLLRAAGLPVDIPGLDAGELMRAMTHDKKVKQGRLTFALLKSIGDVFLTDRVDNDVVEGILRGEK